MTEVEDVRLAPPAALPAGFTWVRVAAREELCADAVALTIEPPADAGPGWERFAAGQHLTVAVEDPGGDQLRRTYSLTGAAPSGPLRIGVRALPAGRVSGHLVREVRVGDRLAMMPPGGSFTAPIVPERRATWLLVGAGSGITPLLSHLHTVLEHEPGSSIVLLYGNRGVDSVMFRQELAALKSRYLQRLTILHFLSQERRRAGFLDGRIGPDAIARLPQLGINPAGVCEALTCGPPGLIDAASEALIELGIPAEHVHAERFDTTGAAASRPVPAPDADTIAEARVRLYGIEAVVPVRAGETILDACHRAGMDVPYSCTGGVCATCRAHVPDGSAQMHVNYALAEDEVTAGHVLTCQAVPDGGPITVDFDSQ